MASRKNYTREQMAKAIEEVRKGEKISVAATRYGVPRITLHNKVTGKSPVECNLGPATVLTCEEESILVRWIIFMAEKHFPVTKEQLLDSVQKIISQKNIDSCPFKNNRPGKKWYSSFLKRHPELSERVAQNLSKARDQVTEEDILLWFKVIRDYLKRKDLLMVLNDPKRIFNTDESAFYLQPRAGRVIVRKGEKNVYSASGDEKENLTVLVTCNAAGFLAPPMIVYPYERLPAVIANSVPKDWCIGRSSSGWMCARTFYEYITNVFNPWIEKNNIPKPAILFLDGHKSHMTLHLSDFCSQNGIEVISLYPNTTHLLQPMDVAVFRPLKVSWQNQVKRWKMENPAQTLKREHFAPNFEAAMQKITTDTIRNGFRKGGLFPFGAEYVDMNKISSKNRATIVTSALQKKINTTKQFMNILESEIRRLFTNEKLNLFTRLYYIPRADVEKLLPNEDLSLYIIWADTKHYLDENLPLRDTTTITEPSIQVSHASEFEHVGESDSFPPQTSVASVAAPSIYSLPEDVLDVSHHISEKPSELIGTEDTQEVHFGLSTSQVSIDMNTISIGNSDFLEKDIERTTSDLDLSKMTSKVIAEQPNYATPNKVQTSGPTLSESLPSTSQNIRKENNESVIELSKTMPKDTACSLMYITPDKVHNSESLDNISQFISLKQNVAEENIPSPFKRALFWPDQEIKKRRSKERLPSAITSDSWRAYMIKKENEKKQKEEERNKRIKERQEKRLIKNKIAKKTKKVTYKKKINKRKRMESPSSSAEENDIPYEESDQDVEFSEEDRINHPKHLTESIESDENTPLNDISLQILKENTFVIIKYEGEYFPGIIKNTDVDTFEISTMVLSRGNTFRWPDTPDQIWYSREAIIEKIHKPKAVNNRGFFKVPEMEKYLPFIC